MLYLVTGANGTGKTLLTLKHVKALADKEARPVCHNGRFEPVPGGPLDGWKKIDAKDWQAEPDGTIFFLDEAHNDFPKRGNSEPVPEYVRMLAEHRRRGFDFFIITQHPMNLDAFVRRLIGNPGWHRHLKRVAGASLVSQIHWDAVNAAPEKAGSSASGQVSMVPYPKEVYAWYVSAQMHTAKVKIPRAVWVILAAIICVPVLGFVAWRTLMGNSALKLAQQSAAAAPGQAASAPAANRPPPERKPMTAAEYVQARTPRFDGLPYTAPAYDAVTAPVVAPYPAACVHRPAQGKAADRCDCYTQQATKLAVPAALCVQIASQGFFVDWHQQLAPSMPARVAPVAAVKEADGAGMSVIPWTKTPSPWDLPAKVDTAAADGANVKAMRTGERIVR
jgi:zona occludens toxin